MVIDDDDLVGFVCQVGTQRLMTVIKYIKYYSQMIVGKMLLVGTIILIIFSKELGETVEDFVCERYLHLLITDEMKMKMLALLLML